MTEVRARTRTPVRERQVEVVEGDIRVSRTLYGQMVERVEKITVRRFLAEPAYVKVSGGLTMNLGDMQFARVDVAVTLPCYANADDLRGAKDFAAQLVDQFIGEEQEAIRSGGQPQNG